MPRAKGGVTGRRRHQTVLSITKGQYGVRGRLFRKANEAMLKSLAYAYRDRRNRKRDMRRLWITRINAAARANGLTYGQFTFGLRQAGVEVDRKILADMAVQDPAGFGKLVETARAAM
ncbi:MAG: 50S ribosomal protein L20 [Chloroflexi bacterium]|nr:50S ribosomal protein L20 [Chloroflexota bacterium]